jgi:hypothetical protein
MPYVEPHSLLHGLVDLGDYSAARVHDAAGMPVKRVRDHVALLKKL